MKKIGEALKSKSFYVFVCFSILLLEMDPETTTTTSTTTTTTTAPTTTKMEEPKRSNYKQSDPLNLILNS